MTMTRIVVQIDPGIPAFQIPELSERMSLPNDMVELVERKDSDDCTDRFIHAQGYQAP